MQRRIRDFWESIQYLHPYVIAAIVSLVLIIILVFALSSLIPFTTASASHAALTVIAEILGVLLGVFLIIITLLIEQIRQAESVITRAFPKYNKLAKLESNAIIAGRKQLIDLIAKGEVSLHEPTFEEVDISFREAINYLSTLSAAINVEDTEKIEKDLEKIWLLRR